MWGAGSSLGPDLIGGFINLCFTTTCSRVYFEDIMLCETQDTREWKGKECGTLLVRFHGGKLHKEIEWALLGAGLREEWRAV